jgi:hypothetical protein
MSMPRRLQYEDEPRFDAEEARFLRVPCEEMRGKVAKIEKSGSRQKAQTDVELTFIEIEKNVAALTFERWLPHTLGDCRRA